VKEVGEAETLYAGSVQDSDGVALDNEDGDGRGDGDDAILDVRMEKAR
jgi:hypothetical protein